MKYIITSRIPQIDQHVVINPSTIRVLLSNLVTISILLNY